MDGTAHLIALGHRRITFIVNALDLVNSRERAQGYQDAMQRAERRDVRACEERSGAFARGEHAERRRVAFGIAHAAHHDVG
ncbi:substrate-binding domain-containing protein, partial [Paraburkholderia sp. BR14319]|uniref:substrate-binding domain-containing protein n=1 Tax=Paraburkholderia sp. BR14319 TaxID=3237005 RepID=UPI0034D16CC7